MPCHFGQELASYYHYYYFSIFVCLNFLLYQISTKGLVFYQIIDNYALFIQTNSYCVGLWSDFISFQNLTKENEVVVGVLPVIMNEGGSHHLDHYCPHAMADSLHLSLVRQYQ